MAEQLYRVRQEDIAPVLQMHSRPVQVIGAGGVNSHFCLQGAKLGFNLTVYDGDRVAEENVGSQLFGPAHVGRPKVEVVQELCLTLAAARIAAVDAFVVGGEPLQGIVVEAVDTMKAREEIWGCAILPRKERIDAYVSIRMGAESGTVIVVHPAQPEDQIFYETEALYSDERAAPLPCTGRATSYCASIAASLGVRAVKRLLMCQPVERRLEFELNGLLFMVDDI